ncbi:MAG TPA: helix-turn-helix domain-containing protein [Chitinophaga sp.]|uniref:helix-turn-helix domain-containing protein n=1 Tax=Chitinophaga sp. TaxID=1869181 RepID=UPI002BA1A772|nr:helix-turn-helix domain-containing protein [Chitinophaga sp.]HVI47305.1 helix-turn-helix domain-containing protein [Chitinophaga sp.]
MKKIETAEDYFNHKGIIPASTSLFNVFESEGLCTEPMIYNRRDFYKIALMKGTSRLSWHGQVIEVNRPALIFYNPHVPYAWSPVSPEQPGFFCLFKKEFLRDSNREESLRHSPLFRTGIYPVYFPDKVQLQYIHDIFSRMYKEIQSDYIYKYDLLRSHLHLIIHEALKMERDTFPIKHQHASGRITALFFEMLERQFPIDSPERSLQLKTAGDYAKVLSVHVNHLNHAVKEVTGRPTSMHISDRLLAEAKALLRHTDWPIAHVASGLGFEYPNYFYNFFKKRTGYSPRQIRMGVI